MSLARARAAVVADDVDAAGFAAGGEPWLRTNGVNTNGAAAKVMNFDRFGKKVLPGTLGKIKVGKQEYPKCPSVKKKLKKSAVTPLVLTPMRPSPRAARRRPSPAPGPRRATGGGTRASGIPRILLECTV